MMNSNQSLTPPSPLPRAALWSLLVFSFLGFADAAYLTADHYLALPLPCSLTQGCDVVLKSEYAVVAGFPIALFGALYYLAILLGAVYIYTSNDPSGSVRRVIFGITTLGLLVSLTLLYLQVFVIQALCVYCLVSGATTLLLFISSWTLVRQTRQI